MPTEDARFRVIAETSEAEQELQKLRKEVAEIRREFAQLNNRMSGTGGATSKLTKNLTDAEPVIGKVATGVSGLSGTLGGAVGQTNALTGASANLAAAFAGGGALAVGLTFTITGIGLLIEKFMKARTEAKNLQDEANAIGKDLVKRYGDEAQTALASKQKELLNLTLGDKAVFVVAEQEIARSREELQRQSIEGWGKVAEAKRALASVDWMPRSLRKKWEEQQVMYQKQADDADAQLDLLEAEEDALVDIAREYKKAAEAVDVLKKAKKEAAAAETAVSEPDVDLFAERRRRLKPWFEERKKLQAAAFEEQQAKAAAAEEAIRQLRLQVMREDFAEFDANEKAKRDLQIRLAKDAARKEERAHKKMLREKKRAEEEAQKAHEELIKERVDLAMQFAQFGLDTTNQVMEAAITGQLNSIDQLLAAQLKALGLQVQGIGMKYVAEGIGLTVLGAPNGPAVLGAGLAGVAAGTAMAGGGMAWSHIAAGGTIGQALPGATGGAGRSSRGVGSTRSRDSSDGASAAPQETATHYHFHAPTYDPINSARSIHAQNRRADERLLEGAEA